jgi:hypothetical protein
MVMSPMGLRPENECTGAGQQQLYMTDPSSHQRGCYIRTMTTGVHLKRRTDWRYTASRKVILTLTIVIFVPVWRRGQIPPP